MENEPVEMLLHQTTRLYMKYAMSKLHTDGKERLHGGQAGILFLLKFKGGMSQKELADMLHLSAPSVTTAIRKLEGEKCVIRRQDEKDQRVMRISITPKGEEFVQHVIEVAKQTEEAALKNISKEEKLLFYRLLRQVRDNLIEGTDGKDGKII
ncbi:MAG: MarR family transcriptional regulator [Hespellia sp.]|nr:MarR family transcriptional regulator [Hespellia sp.]